MISLEDIVRLGYRLWLITGTTGAYLEDHFKQITFDKARDMYPGATNNKLERLWSEAKNNDDAEE